MKTGRKAAAWALGLCIAGSAVALAACAPHANPNASLGGDALAGAEAPEADGFGVVTADSWKDIFPDQYATYEQIAENSPESGKADYLEMYPALRAMYKGYGFAKGYDEAAGHEYTLRSISETPRVNDTTLANCITCKTPQFTAMVNSEGDGVYAQKFADLLPQFTEPISCYNCHENDPTSLTVTNAFYRTSMGADLDNDAKAPKAAQVCGQCHNEYYFKPDTKATANPYEGLSEMTPDAILAFYDERGFADWTHPDTGARMIKVQHPEFETVYGGEQSPMAKIGYTCADCHMGTQVGEDGTYTSHNLTSPLDNPDLLASDCNTCHGDLAAEVSAIQAQEEERVIAISEKIERLISGIAAAREAGTLSGDALAELQNIHRTSQFYWDFVMVENSEGAHNSALTHETLDKAEAAVDRGLAML